mmetsp:Transcript_35142/g.81005  ORF Transcript_35142/g.81005 Transcript_35142/m.81005 type:complete len:263 (-) Transcript_35142:1254-2042(-)
MSQISRSHSPLAIERRAGGKEGFGRLLREVQVASGQAGPRDGDLANSLHTYHVQARIKDSHGLGCVRMSCCDEPALVSSVRHVLEALHLQLGHVTLLRATVARVEDASGAVLSLGNHGHNLLAEVHGHRGTPDADVREARRKALLCEEVQHRRDETAVSGAEVLGKLVELGRHHNVFLIVWEVEASAPGHERPEEVVQEGHPCWGVIAQCLRGCAHSLGLRNPSHQGRDVSVRQDNALRFPGRAASEQSQGWVILRYLHRRR